MNDFWWGYLAGRIDGDRSIQRGLIWLVLYVLLGPLLSLLAAFIVSGTFYGQSPSAGLVIGAMAIGAALQAAFWALQWRPAGRRRR